MSIQGLREIGEHYCPTWVVEASREINKVVERIIDVVRGFFNSFFEPPYQPLTKAIIPADFELLPEGVKECACVNYSNRVRQKVFQKLANHSYFVDLLNGVLRENIPLTVISVGSYACGTEWKMAKIFQASGVKSMKFICVDPIYNQPSDDNYHEAIQGYQAFERMENISVERKQSIDEVDEVANGYILGLAFDVEADVAIQLEQRMDQFSSKKKYWLTATSKSCGLLPGRGVGQVESLVNIHGDSLPSNLVASYKLVTG